MAQKHRETNERELEEILIPNIQYVLQKERSQTHWWMDWESRTSRSITHSLEPDPLDSWLREHPPLNNELRQARQRKSMERTEGLKGILFDLTDKASTKNNKKPSQTEINRTNHNRSPRQRYYRHLVKDMLFTQLIRMEETATVQGILTRWTPIMYCWTDKHCIPLRLRISR